MIKPCKVCGEEKEIAKGAKCDKCLKRTTRVNQFTPADGIIDAASLPKTEFIPTGHPELDAIIHGFPRRRVTEIYGLPSVGKTTLMLQTIVSLAADLRVLYLDLENALDPLWLRSLGIKPGRMNIAAPLVLEDAAELMLTLLPDYDLIVFDSVASALTRTEDTGVMGDRNVGVKALVMTQFMRKLIGPLGKSSCAAVFINQEKEKIGIPYGEPTYTPGGKALEYAASMRLKLSTRKADRRDGGKTVHVEVTKSKVSMPYVTADFLVFYNPVEEEV